MGHQGFEATMSSLIGIEPMTPAVIEPRSVLAEQASERRETNILQRCWATAG
jgi:hypothetical protein